MDGWVSTSIWRLEGLSHFNSIVKPVQTREELYLYLAVSPHAVSSALIIEKGKVQKPVYYTS